MTLHHPPDPTFTHKIAAAMGWWRDAGVDCSFSDEPHSLLAAAQKMAALTVEAGAAPDARQRSAPTLPADPAPARYNAAQCPAELTAFARWWTASGDALPGPTAPRVAPQGMAGAQLLVLVPMPEAEDREALLQGPQGRLVKGLNRALALGDPYLASALPAHTVMPDWRNLRAQSYGDIVRHHLMLARPQRVLIMGADVLDLLGMERSFADDPGLSLTLASGPVPVIATYAPERLLAHPREQARLWQRLLKWTARQ